MFGKNAYADLTDLTIDANAGSYVKADAQKYRTYVGGIVGFMGEGNQTVMNVISNINVIGSTCDIGSIAGIAHYGNKFINVVCAAELIQLVNANDDGDHLEIGGIAGVWNNKSGTTVLLLNCSAENTTLKSSLQGVDRSEDVKGNDITDKSYSAIQSGSLIIGNVKTSETGSECVFTVSGPKAADDLKAIFGDSLQDNGDGTYTSTTFDMSAIYVNEAWTGKKNGDMVEYGVIGVNAFAKANDAINAAGANATIKIQDARDYNTPITRASYTENLTIETQENDYSQLYMTVSGKTYTYGEEDENGNAVRHDATVEYKGQDIFFGGHSHFESLAGMTVKFTSTEVTHEGGTPFFKVYGDSNVVFDGACYANDNGNLWFYVSGQLDLQNNSNLETDGGSGFRILAAGGKVNVDKASLLRVSGSNISIGSYDVYSDKTAKAVVGGKKQGHDADGSNDYSATLNITNRSGLVNVNGIVRVGASYILDNATADELEGLTITDNPDKPANYADLAKACLNITDASAAELDRLYVDRNGAVTIRNSTLTANSITLADGSSLTFVNGAKATLGNTTTASTARGNISVEGYETELNLIGDIKYGRTNTATDFTVKNNAAVTVNGNIELGYFTQTSGVMAFYKGCLSLTDNAKFTTTGTVTVFLDSAIAMDHTSRLTFGGLTAQNASITIAVSGYTDGIYKVMENTGANAVDYATVISNWSEIENIGYTILDNSLYIGKADAENDLVNATYSKYEFGDAIEGKTGYFYGFNAFSSLDEAGRAVKEATRTITVEADLTEDVNTPLFDLKGDLILTAEAPVTVTWNVIGNAADAPDTDGKVSLVSKDGLNHTFTIGKNVTLNVPQSSWGGAFYVGYQSAWATKLNIDGKVNTYLFYIGAKSEVTISKTGSLTTTSENLIMRWDSKLTVNGNGTLDENNPQVKLSYASIQGGDLVLNNTVMNAGSWLEMWNRNKVDGKQAPALTMDNSVLIAGGLTASDAEEAVISLNNNSTVKINGNAANAGTMSVTDSVLNVDETLTNSGTINVKAGKKCFLQGGRTDQQRRIRR